MDDNVSELFPKDKVVCETDELCPVCGQGKMILSGTITLCIPKDRKSTYTHRLYEEEF